MSFGALGTLGKNVRPVISSISFTLCSIPFDWYCDGCGTSFFE